jgi:hypothetical protein
MLIVTRKTRTILLFVLIFLIFISSPRFLGTIDGSSTRVLTLSILEEGNFDLDEYIPEDNTDIVGFVYINTGDHFISKYPVLTSILALPIYAGPYFAGVSFTREVVATLANITAALITTFSAIFLLFIFRKYLSEKWSIFLVVAYAFGTSSWTISSQDLWQHGTSQLFLILVVYLLLKPKKSDLIFLLTGLAIGLAVAARYLNIIFAVIFLIYILYKYREKIVATLLGLLVPLSLIAIYQSYYLNSPWHTGYSCELQKTPCIEGWNSLFWDGFGGLLVSPGRGLFIFTPFLLFSVIGAWYIWKRKKENKKNYNLLLRYLSIGVLVFILVMSKWWAWYGGVTYGPRMLVDIVPFLMLLFIPVVKNGLFRKKIILGCFILLVLFSMVVQFAGAIHWDKTWGVADTLVGDHSWLWDWDNSQLTYYLKRLF